MCAQGSLSMSSVFDVPTDQSSGGSTFAASVRLTAADMRNKYKKSRSRHEDADAPSPAPIEIEIRFSSSKESKPHARR